jgi:hypothetical protein
MDKIEEKQPQHEDPKILLRRLLDTNPNILQEFGLGMAKKQKKPVLKPGTVITIPQERQEPEEIIKVISQRKAKKLLEENGVPKRTRTISDEVKAQMLENLRRGREKLKAQRDEKIKQVQEEKQVVEKQTKIPVKKEILVQKAIKNEGPVIKYIVKPKAKREVKKFVKADVDSEDEVSSSMPTDSESEISDTTLLRKIKRNIKSIKQVDKVIEDSKKPEIAKPRYNLWYS